MSELLPIEIATWAGGITFGCVAAGMLLMAAINNLRGKAKPVDPLGALFGTAVLGGVPVAIILFCGLFVSAGLIELGTPPIAYLFVGTAACLSFGVSLGRPSHGLEGCTKMFVVMWSAYATVWSAVSFVMLGGPEWFARDALSLTWLRPILVAAPYAAAFARVADKKRRTWPKFLGALVFISAFAALMFLPIEAGFATHLLPASDWLRFPIVAVAVALVAAVVPVLINLRSAPAVRKRRLRELPRQARLLSLILLPAGLLWAAARALTGVLA
jgi:hypothetical protein